VILSRKDLFQKRTGCVEHTAIANALINDAAQKRKSIYVLSLDSRDVFGSLQHDIVNISMQQLGIPDNIMIIVMESYECVFIQMQTKSSNT
jgi:hypothetical protein